MMTCYTVVDDVVIVRRDEDECEAIEELINITKGLNGDCKKALTALRILRHLYSMHQIYMFYKRADSALARYIEDGGCK